MKRGTWLIDKDGRKVAAVHDGTETKPISEPKPPKATKDGD